MDRSSFSLSLSYCHSHLSVSQTNRRVAKLIKSPKVDGFQYMATPT